MFKQWHCLLRAYRGLKQFSVDFESAFTCCLLRAYRGLKPRCGGGEEVCTEEVYYVPIGD